MDDKIIIVKESKAHKLVRIIFKALELLILFVWMYVVASLVTDLFDNTFGERLRQTSANIEAWQQQQEAMFDTNE